MSVRKPLLRTAPMPRAIAMRSLVDRYYTGENALAWADIVLDIRYTDREPAPLYAPFPEAGTPKARNGLFVLPALDGHSEDDPAHGTTLLSWHILGDPSDGVYAVKVTYGDGLSVAYVGTVAGWMRGRTHMSVWKAYQRATNDALGMFLSIGDMHGCKDPAVLAAARSCTQAFRAALVDPAGWLITGKMRPGVGAQPSAELAFWASAGLPDYRTAQEFSAQIKDRIEVPEVLRAGFDLSDANERAWIAAAVDGGWHLDHAEEWHEIRRIQQEGWSSQAATILHQAIQDTRVRRRAEWDIETGAVDWVRLLGTAQKASAYITAGFGLREAAHLIDGGTPPSAETLMLLGALRAPRP